MAEWRQVPRAHRVNRFALAIAVAIAVLPGLALPAAANHRQPIDGEEHAFGEMVRYRLVFPVDGPHDLFDSFYSCRGSPCGYHHAQDIMAPKMTPVRAVAAGTVRWVNYSSNPDDLRPERCCTIVIQHGDGWDSWYLHLNNDTPGTDDGNGWGIAEGILPGTRVTAGQLIGWVGDSGNAEWTGSHLHFELYDPEDVIVNPYDALVKSRARGHPRCAGKLATHLDGDMDGVVSGTDGDDVIIGSGRDDTIHGGDGDDVICSRRGDDLIDAGAGQDRIYPSKGDDVVDAGEGKDKIYGGHGTMTLDGGPGRDVVNYRRSKDPYVVDLGLGTANGDLLVSVENAIGSKHDDVIIGSADRNVLRGSGGLDQLVGLEGNDTLLGQSGVDTADGGDGDDRCDAETLLACEA